MPNLLFFERYGYIDGWPSLQVMAGYARKLMFWPLPIGKMPGCISRGRSSADEFLGLQRGVSTVIFRSHGLNSTVSKNGMRSCIVPALEKLVIVAEHYGDSRDCSVAASRRNRKSHSGRAQSARSVQSRLCLATRRARVKGSSDRGTRLYDCPSFRYLQHYLSSMVINRHVVPLGKDTHHKNPVY